MAPVEGLSRKAVVEDEDGLTVYASRPKAAVLSTLGAFVVVAFAGVDWFRWTEPAIKWAAIIFGLAFVAYFVTFALMLAFRRKPVFTVDAEGIGMPTGGMGFVRVPWEEVAGYGRVVRGLRLIPGLASEAFGVRLTPEALRSQRFSISQEREFKLNRASMSADILLTHWFSPLGFDAILAGARRFRPDLDITEAMQAERR
ncbi:MAG: hypothetical protein AAF675_13860 [Pseudomonadota bacterium]